MTVTPETEIGYKFTPEAIEALKEQGFTDLPQGVVINHREASNREKRQFNDRIEALMKPGALDDETAQEFLVNLLMRRVKEGTPREYVKELVSDMGETDMASHLMAFMQGVMPDPKVVGPAVQAIRTGMSSRLLTATANASRPFFATFTPDSSSAMTTSLTDG